MLGRNNLLNNKSFSIATKKPEFSQKRQGHAEESADNTGACRSAWTPDLATERAWAAGKRVKGGAGEPRANRADEHRFLIS